MIYKAAKGAALSDEQAQQYGEHIASTFGNGHLGVTPDELVEDARNPDSPTHDFFEWDDSAAAAHYRNQQARYLLRAIHVVIESDNEEIETRAFVHVSVSEPEKEPRKVYTTVQHALSNDELKVQVIEEALRQLERWRKRWSQYNELATVFAAIDQVQEEMALVPA